MTRPALLRLSRPLPLLAPLLMLVLLLLLLALSLSATPRTPKPVLLSLLGIASRKTEPRRVGTSRTD